MKKILILLVLVMLPFVPLLGCDTSLPSGDESGDGNNNGGGESGQTWVLTFHDSGSAPHPQTVTVYVTPFTIGSGTWGETGESAGLWMFGPDGVCTYKLMVGGNVVPDSPGDRFSCVSLAGAGCGMQTVGSCDFVANGNFPDATTVSGTFTLTTNSPIGTATGTNTLDGYLR